MGESTRKKLFLANVTLLVGVLLWDIVLFILPDKTTPWHYAYNIAYALIFFLGGAVGIGYARTPQGKGTFGRALAFVGLGLIAWGLGLLVWAYYNFFSDIEIPYPSLADVLFVLFYPFFGIAVWYLLKIYRPLVTTRLVSESILIILVAMTITIAINGPNFESLQAPYDPNDPETEGLSMPQKIFTFLYPIGDIVILSGVLIVLRVGGGKIQRSTLLLIAGDIADTFYTLAAFVTSLGIIESLRVTKTPLPPGVSAPMTPTS